MVVEEKYMKRCLELAKQGQGNVEPNPMVGAVIVHNGKIIGEGYHQKYGEAHAEVHAINSVKDKALLKEATIYVSLEPCAHFGKTPPCSHLIVQSQIPNVVVACVDSFSEVSGKGIEYLKKAGCTVSVGLLEKEALELNKRFFTFHTQKRPYVILKWAQSADGFIDMERTAETPIGPLWITGAEEKHLVHKWRSQESAIMIATNTALKDNPSLTTREWFGKNPIRVVIDRELKLSLKLKIFENSVKTIIFNSIKNEISENTEYIRIDFDQEYSLCFREMLERLHQKEILSIIVEGGSILHESAINGDLWDEARVFVGRKTFGKGKKAALLPFTAINKIDFEMSSLYHYRKY